MPDLPVLEVHVNFLALDFETADSARDSACAVGVCRVEKGQIVARQVRLIRPPRGVSSLCYSIHNLSYAVLQKHPPFAKVWPEVLPLLAGVQRIAAHNVAFDRAVLKACCAAAGLTPPNLPWVCTLELARHRWPGQPNRLPDVCGRLEIDLGNHHEAGADAEACARCLLALEGFDYSPRTARIVDVFGRAQGRDVYGFDSRSASCRLVIPGKVPPEIDRLCVAGDTEWVTLDRGDLLPEPEWVEPEPTPGLYGRAQ